VLVRLALRKPQWHRVSALKYHGEVGEAGLKTAVKELCRRLLPQKPIVKVEQDPVDIIDLISDDEDTPVKKEEDKQPRVYSVAPERPVFSLSSFCFSESDMTLEQVLNALSSDQIKELMKQAKVTTMQGYKSNVCIVECLTRNVD
jgi:hypothetical protein